MRAMCPECQHLVLVRHGVIGPHLSAAQGMTGVQCLGTGTQVIPDDPLQTAVDLAEMLRYTATLAVEGKPATGYLAMLASIRGELNRLFSADLAAAAHSPLPAPTHKESS